jgi:hypothetical protein
LGLNGSMMVNVYLTHDSMTHNPFPPFSPHLPETMMDVGDDTTIRLNALQKHIRQGTSSTNSLASSKLISSGDSLVQVLILKVSSSLIPSLFWALTSGICPPSFRLP